MAFKMKGKSPMMKALIGKQHNLPPELKAKIEASPMKTGDHSDATGHKHGISKNLKKKPVYDKRVETREEVMKANALEDKNNDAAAKRAYAKMMKAKKASPNKKSPIKKGKIDAKTGTLYQDGMAISDRPNARSEFKHSGIEVEAAKALGSRRVNRVQKRADKKSSKLSKKVKLGGKARVGRVADRRRKRSRKASNKADKVTTKRFQNTEQGGKDGYNRLIERDNKRRKETAAAKDADKK